MIIFKKSLELKKLIKEIFSLTNLFFIFFFFSRIKGFLMIAQDIEIY